MTEITTFLSTLAASPVLGPEDGGSLSWPLAGGWLFVIGGVGTIVWAVLLAIGDVTRTRRTGTPLGQTLIGAGTLVFGVTIVLAHHASTIPGAEATSTAGIVIGSIVYASLFFIGLRVEVKARKAISKQSDRTVPIAAR